MISSIEEKTEITWDMVLQEWPEEANHYMEEVPRWVSARWTVLCHVGDVELSDWWKDISPSCILQQSGRIQGLIVDQSIWLQQRMPQNLKTLIRDAKGSDLQFNVLTISANMVLCCSGILTSMLKETPLLFSSSDLQSLRIMSGLPLGTIQQVRIGTSCSQPRNCYIYLVTRGPNVTDVKAFPGKPESLTESMTDNTTIWSFCSKPQSRDEIVVPLALRAAWLQRQFKPQMSADFLRPEYYQTSMSSYSAWSFSLHSAQVSQALSKVPLTKWIVAPGDGIGVVSSVWQGSNKVVAGDKNVSPFADYQVTLESFELTMKKGILHEGSVLVLSYVYSLMSTLEREFADSWPGPVVWVDNVDYCPMPGMCHIGPGVYVRKFEADWIPAMTVVEKQTSYSSLLYTENLIRLESIRSYSDSPSVRYWQEMRPFAEFGKQDAILVVHDLRELVVIWRDYPHEKLIYLASIGQYYQPYVTTSLGLSSVFHERQIYGIRKGSPLIAELKQHAQWAEYLDLFLFCFPLLLLRDVTSLISMQGVTAHYQFKVISTSHVIVHQPYRLMGRTGLELLVNSPGGLVLWKLDCKLLRYLIMVYMTYYGREGWKLIVTNDFNTKWSLRVHMPTQEWVPVGGHYYVSVAKRIWEIYQTLEGLFPNPLLTPLAWQDGQGRTVISILCSEGKMNAVQAREYSSLENLFTGLLGSYS